MNVYLVVIALALSSCAIKSAWETESYQWHDRVVKGR